MYTNMHKCYVHTYLQNVASKIARLSKQQPHTDYPWRLSCLQIQYGYNKDSQLYIIINTPCTLAIVVSIYFYAFNIH